MKHNINKSESITEYEYLKARSIIILFENENGKHFKEKKRYNNLFILLEHIFSTRLYKCISKILDNNEELSFRRFNFDINTYCVNDLKLVNKDEVLKYRNIGTKCILEFDKWLKVANNDQPTITH